MKTCSKCNVPKPFSSFLRHKMGYRRICKDCNPVLCPKCKLRPPKKSGGYCQPCTTQYNFKWHRDNPGKNKIYNDGRTKYQKQWRNSQYARNPGFRLRVLLGNRLAEVVRRIHGRRTGPVMELVGCSRAQLREHVESLFKPGMTWENHGIVWHLDHRKPCAAFDFSDPCQQRDCFHWSNLQPLFALDNLRKSDNYETPSR